MVQSHSPHHQPGSQSACQGHASSSESHTCQQSASAGQAASSQPYYQTPVYTHGVGEYGYAQAGQQPDYAPYYSYGSAEYGYQAAAPAAGMASWIDFSNGNYLKGFLLGAGTTLVLTNSTVQKTLVRSTVKLWSLLQGGVEEVKEQFRDIKAEMSQEE